MSVYQARVDIARRFGIGKEPHGVPIFLATCIKQSINLNKTLRMSLWEARRVTPLLMGHEKLQIKLSFFGNFMSGTFVKTTLCARSLWGGRRGKFSSRVQTEDISRSPSKSHRVFLSSDTKNCWSRQEDAEFDFSLPRARIAILLGNM